MIGRFGLKWQFYGLTFVMWLASIINNVFLGSISLFCTIFIRRLLLLLSIFVLQYLLILILIFFFVRCFAVLVLFAFLVDYLDL